MLIDGFTFFNELDVLYLRLKELYNHVDKFVLVEGSKTQSGNDKPFYFEENKQKFAPFLNKIEHVKVEDWPEKTDDWRFDIYQRQCIQRGFENLGVTDTDIVMVSDVDEIPWPQALQALSPTDVRVLRMYYNVYRWNLRVENFFWNGTVAAPWSVAKRFDMHSFIKLRDRYAPECFLEQAGVHYGYQGGPDLIHHKYFSCVEPFDKVNGIPNKEDFLRIFEERSVDGGSFIFSDNLSRKDMKLKKCDELHSTILEDERYHKFLL